MEILARTSNILIRIREFHVDYLDNAYLGHRVIKGRESAAPDGRLDRAFQVFG
jgi:hypothetical protein